MIRVSSRCRACGGFADLLGTLGNVSAFLCLECGHAQTEGVAGRKAASPIRSLRASARRGGKRGGTR